MKNLAAGAGIEFRARGRHALKGVPGAWDLFAAGGDGSHALAAVPSERLRATDRVAMRFARRAPGVLRSGAHLIRRRSRRAASSAEFA